MPSPRRFRASYQFRNLVKGYGETYEHGLTKYEKIRSDVLRQIKHPDLIGRPPILMEAAERDENGAALDLAIQNKTADFLTAAHELQSSDH